MGKPPFHPNDKVRNYTIAQQFDIGGMGAVYRVQDEDIFIKAPFADSGKALFTQFREEVKALQRLEHVGIAQIVDFDLDAPIPWCATEMVSGETLRDIIKSEAPLATEEALTYMLQITDAVAHAHQHTPPILHKHLQPETICQHNNHLIILDYGLSHFGYSTPSISSSQTRLLYMAPEQLDLRSRATTHTDVYSLGVILYEMLSGNVPFGDLKKVGVENSRLQFIEEILDPSLAPVPLKDIEPELWKVCQQALHKKPGNRYGDASEMHRELKATLKNYLHQLAEKKKQQGQIQEAARLFKQAVKHGLPRKHLQSFEREFPESTKDSSQQKSFREHLSEMLALWQTYSQSATFLHKEQASKKLIQALGVKNTTEDWQKFIHELETLRKGILRAAPLEVRILTPNEEESAQQEPGVSVESRKKKATVEKQPPCPEEVEQAVPVNEDDLPTSVMPQIKVGELSASSVMSPGLQSPGLEDSPALEAEEAKDEEEGGLHDSADYVVILEQSQASSTQNAKIPDKELPTGFRWLDEHHILCEKDKSVMVYVPAGVFLMGSNARHAFPNENPEHQVYLDDYFIDKYPVTWKQYLQFCDETSYQYPAAPRWGIYENHPVVNISWYDALAYSDWAGKALPTEAQWEKSARGGLWLDGDSSQQLENSLPQRIYPWGNDDPTAGGKSRANHKDDPSYGRNRGQKSTSEVGRYPQGSSPYGCCDMAGNVWEWCRDWFGEDYYLKSPFKNPSGPSETEATKVGSQGDTERVLRGGSWYTGSRFLRATARRNRNPEGRGGSCGMRGAGVFF